MRRRTKRSILRYLPDAAPADGHTDEYLQHRHTASERDDIKVRVKSGSTRQAVSHLPPSSDASPTGNRVPECRKGNQTDYVVCAVNEPWPGGSANVRSKDAEKTTEYQSKCDGKYPVGKRGSMEIWK